MDRVWEANAALTPPSVPTSFEVGYAQTANAGTLTQATEPGVWWFHMITEELRAVLAAGGVTPDPTKINQLQQAIVQIANAAVISGGVGSLAALDPTAAANLIAATSTATTALAQSNSAITTANAAASNASSAISQLASISSDNVLSSGEKSAVILDYSNVTSEQAGIDAAAVQYGITVEKTSYDNAVTALTTYLGTLTTPTLWNSTSGNTTIVGATFRSTWASLYAARQVLLNKISVTAQTLAAAAQATANSSGIAASTAQSTANTALSNAGIANAELANIASDNILSSGEKSRVVKDYSVITSEQPGIDATATSYGITTELTAYDNSITALTNYLNTLTGWNIIPGSDVTIVGTTFRANFASVYSARQTLLNRITAIAGTVALWTGIGSRPVNLVSLTGAESINNAAISIGANGALSGGSGGQVTLPGIGLKTYRVAAQGLSATAAPIGAGLYMNGSATLVESAVSSYNVAVIDRGTGNITGFQQFYVLGSAAAATAMAAYLNALNASSIVVIWTYDEPQTNRLANGLDTAMYRCGASAAVYGSANFQYRSAYILVAIAGCGQGNGAEAYQGSVSSDTNAWCDLSFSLQAGNIIGVSSVFTPKSLVDYGYVGALNANFTTNTNQLTDGSGLGQTATWTGVSGAGKPADNATVGATFGVNVGGQAATANIAPSAVTTDRIYPNAATVASNSTFSSGNAAFTSVGSLSMVNDAALPITNTGSRVTTIADIGLYLGVNAGPALAWIQVNWSLRMDGVVYDFAQSIPYHPITIGGGTIYFKVRMPMFASITPSAAAHNWGYSVSLTMYDSSNTTIACSGQWSTSATIAAQENKV